MEPGTTFLLTEVDNHLWIVLSDPKIDAERVLLVSLTTASALKESVCILEAGEHPWVRHQTCVAYDKAKVISLKNLCKLRDSSKKLLLIQQPISPELLQRVREGAALSVRMTLDLAQILFDQGLIE